METLDDCVSFPLPRLDKDIPERVSFIDLELALSGYAWADRQCRASTRTIYLAEKEEAADRLYQLAKALLRDKGFRDL